MASSIDRVAASRLIASHRSLISDLVAANNEYQSLRSEVKQASDALATQEVLQVLKGVSIDEINREKKGFRVKTLREHGYHTIADIATASVHTLASIHGISEDSAYEIRRTVNAIIEASRQGVKIKLSEDNKSKVATRVIVAVSKLRKKEQHYRECSSLLKNAQTNIENALIDLSPATSGLRWLFTSKKKKEKALVAFEMLTALQNGAYGQNARANLDKIRAFEHTTSIGAWRDFSENSIRFFNTLEDVNPGILGNDDTLYGLPEDLAREIQEQEFFPEGLLCELRRYQEWGVKYVLHQENVLLGDEMGLGKTIQAIATMVSLKNTGATHFMVVCPASVLTNWCREIRKMSRLTVTKIHGYSRYSALDSWIKTGGVAVTTYETTGHINFEDGFKFSLLVVDEAHYIKNPEAQRTIFVKHISTFSERLLFMTGTALENKVDEMISLIKMLQPAVATSVRGMEALASAPLFRKKVAPVYYRRKREDVLTELPELIESREWCNLMPEEESVYEEAILNKNYAQARRVSWSVSDMRHSSKAIRMMELIKEAESEGRKVIVFSFFLDTIRKVRELLGDRCYGPINGSVSPQRRQEIIDEFDKAPPGSVLAAQIQAGGTGLNIQSASVVIICEPQFKPSIENQAISRAYRMGQTRNVLVYRLLCDETVDERITELLETKQEIFDAFADQSEAARESLGLDEKSFGNIIQNEIDRINAKRGNTSPQSPEHKAVVEEGSIVESATEEGSIPELTSEVAEETTRMGKKRSAEIEETTDIESETKILLPQNPYYTWLLQKASKEFLGDIISSYEIIQKFAYQNKLIEQPLFETTDIECIRKIQGQISIRKEFAKLDGNTRYYCGLAMRYYVLYLSELEVLEAEANNKYI